MKRLSLNTGLSYSIRGFSCVKGEPFEVEDGLAEQLLATGRFDEQTVIDNPADESDTDNPGTGEEDEEPKAPENGAGGEDEEPEAPENGAGGEDEEPKAPENGAGGEDEEPEAPENGAGGEDEEPEAPKNGTGGEDEEPEAPKNGAGAGAGVEDGLTASKVSQMRNADLLALAEEKNISLEGCSKHDEYVERINGALGLVDFSKLGLE